MNGFTRQESLDLTGISVALLTRLDENDAVVPIRKGNPKRPSVIYSVEQVVDLKIASELRPRMSLREVIAVIRFVRDSGYFTLAFRFPLMTVGEEVVSAGLPDATVRECRKASGCGSGDRVNGATWVADPERPKLEIIMNLEKLDEIYQSLKSADDHVREHGLPSHRTPSMLLIETLIANNPKDYVTYVLRAISKRLEQPE